MKKKYNVYLTDKIDKNIKLNEGYENEKKNFEEKRPKIDIFIFIIHIFKNYL